MPAVGDQHILSRAATRGEPIRAEDGSGQALSASQHSCQLAVSPRAAHARLRVRPGHERPNVVSFTHGRPHQSRIQTPVTV
ncbi:MAG TPA: hypothetical protein VIY29_02740 [Ktedonobacteraceae bacterium]